MKIKDFYESSVWLDTDKKKSLKEKLTEGLEHYLKKFGSKPDAIFISEKESEQIESDLKFEGIPVAVSKTVMGNHYWYSVKEKRKNGR